MKTRQYSQRNRLGILEREWSLLWQQWLIIHIEIGQTSDENVKIRVHWIAGLDTVDLFFVVTAFEW